MNSRISVDLSSMAQAEDNFSRVLRDVKGQLGQLDSQLRVGLSEWSGEAHDAYQAAHAQWQAAADSMTATLAWLHGVVRTAHENYGSARATNIGMWRGHR